jgi:hypothetical protein
MYGKPTPTVTVNGRSYRAPERPTVVVCVDGSEPGYIEKAVEAGLAPWFARVLAQGTNRRADLAAGARLRNFDVFDLALNRVQAA